MDFKVAIGSDNGLTQGLLQWMIRRWAAERALTCQIVPFADGASMLYEVEDGTMFDVILMEEHLRRESGLALAHRLRKMGWGGAMVMLIRSKMCAVRSYEVGTIGCLTPPYDQIQLDQLMNRVIKRMQNGKLRVRAGGSTRYIPAGEIVYVESDNSRCRIHCADGAEYVTYCKLDEIEQELCSTSFLRCHKSFLINMNAVRDMDAASFEMSDGTPVPIRQRGRSKICRTYLAFCDGQMQMRFSI